MNTFTPDELASVEAALERAARVEKAMCIIANGYEIRTGAPKMDGAFEQHPRLINRNRMMEIAREVLGEG